MNAEQLKRLTKARDKKIHPKKAEQLKRLTKARDKKIHPKKARRGTKGAFGKCKHLVTNNIATLGDINELR